MAAVTRRSRKEDIWREMERLEGAVRSERERAAVLEGELNELRRQLQVLERKVEFAAELREELRGAGEKFSLLARMAKDLASFDLDRVSELCVERIPFLVGVRFASLYLYDDTKRRLLLKNHNHGRPIDVAVDLEASKRSLMGIAIRKRRALVIGDLSGFEDPDEGLPERPNQERYQTSCCIVAPLITSGEVVGVLNLADPVDRAAFTTRADLDLVELVADLVAVSIRNAALFEELKRASKLDALTGVLNHQAFVGTLEIEAKRAHRYRNDLSIVLVDLDGFRLLNANHGRRAADGVLAATARLVKSNVREVDTVGRVGADEFCILLPEQNVQGALVVAKRIGRLVDGFPFDIGGARLQIGATVGVAELRAAEGASELLRAAEDVRRACVGRVEKVAHRG